MRLLDYVPNEHEQHRAARLMAGARNSVFRSWAALATLTIPRSWARPPGRITTDAAQYISQAVVLRYPNDERKRPSTHEP
jgi:hypothetical protein